MHHPYKRSKRVGQLMKEEISDIVLNKLKEAPASFLTITDVDVTDDLKLARVYFSVLREEERATALERLTAARPFIRGEIGRRIRMKVLPDLEFRYDDSARYGSRIETLLRDIKEGRTGEDDDEAGL